MKGLAGQAREPLVDQCMGLVHDAGDQLRHRRHIVDQARDHAAGPDACVHVAVVHDARIDAGHFGGDVGEGDGRAQLALDMFHYWVAKVAGSYVAAMNGVDAIIFTAGVGENASPVRAAVLNRLKHFGVTLDDAVNAVRSKQPRAISTPESAVAALVIPTNEEWMIARHTQALLNL